MRKSRVLAAVGTAVLVLAGAVTTTATASSPTTTRLHPVFQGVRAPLTAVNTRAATRTASSSIFKGPEIKNREVASDEDAPQGGASVQTGAVTPPSTPSVPITQNQSGVVSSFQGLNHFDNRFSGGGNQFSSEPPDQGLCVGGGRVFEIVNSVVQVYTNGGRALIAGNKAFPDGPAVGLTMNEFYGLAPAFVRPAGPFGPNMFDPTCLYDSSSKRWYVTTASLDQDPTTGAYTGTGQVWLAVSTSADPLGSWNIWSIDTTNNGKNGTPNHNCDGGFCFGDYPQIGMDSNGFYITTNEFSFFGAGFNGAQVYALSKADLVAGSTSPTTQVFENVPTSTYNDVSYTMQPVNALPSEWAQGSRGTMYFGMSGSPFTDALARSIVVYALTNTQSLNSSTPALRLNESSVGTQPYATPGYAQQAMGPMPLLACINKASCIGTKYPFIRPPLVLDAGSGGKVYGAWLHNGRVYLTTGTTLTGSGAATYNSTNGAWKPLNQRTGVAWFALTPTTSKGSLQLGLDGNGYVGVQGANLTYPSIVVGPTGAGAIGATLVGPKYYPSAAVARFAPGQAPGVVQITGLGVGPNDGFTATGEGGYRPRWGDYGAATMTPDGTMWLASEYTAQRCTIQEFNADSTCGYTRSFYANWSTRITAVQPLS